MSYKVIAPPIAEPLTRAEVLSHLRVVEEELEPQELLDVDRVIAAARGMLERNTNRFLMPQTVETAAAGFGVGLFLPAPLRALVSITYTDQNGATQVLPDTSYFLDEYVEPATVIAAWSTTWPAVRTGAPIILRTDVGYADAASVPAELKQWMLLAIGTMWDARATTVAGVSFGELPEGFMRWLWHPYMVYV